MNNDQQPQVTENEHNPENKQYDVNHAPMPHVVHVQKSPAKKVLIGLLITLLLAGNVALGYLYYEQSNDIDAYKKQIQELQTSDKLAEATTEDSTEATSGQKQYDKFVQVIQEDGTAIMESPDKIAKNQDQIDILIALRAYCRNQNADYVGVNYKVFDDEALYVNKNGRAFISAANCISESSEGGGARYLLYKNSQGNWYYHFGSQEPPTCDQVDGWGYPLEVISDCYYNSPSAETRAPKQ